MFFWSMFVYRIHKEQMDKWEEEIQELRLLDASNEETKSVLQSAKCLIQNGRGESWR